MRRLANRHVLLGSLIGLGLPLTCFKMVMACTCESNVQKAEPAFRLATAVFEGIATRVSPVPERDFNSFTAMVTIFRVQRIWKGTRVGAQTVVSDGVCGGYFEEGKSYIVYAYKLDQKVAGTRLHTDHCTRTQGASDPRALEPERVILGKARWVRP